MTLHVSFLCQRCSFWAFQGHFGPLFGPFWGVRNVSETHTRRASPWLSPKLFPPGPRAKAKRSKSLFYGFARGFVFNFYAVIVPLARACCGASLGSGLCMAQVPFLNVLLESLSKESRHLRRVAGPLFLPATLEGEGELRLPRETLENMQ